MIRAKTFVLAVLVGLLPWAAAVGSDGEPLTISGEVGIAEEDDDGNPVRVYIDDLDRGAVLVLDTPKGRELIRLLGSTVKVKGLLRESEDPAWDWTIDVSAFELHEPYDDDPEDPARLW